MFDAFDVDIGVIVVDVMSMCDGFDIDAVANAMLLGGTYTQAMDDKKHPSKNGEREQKMGEMTHTQTQHPRLAVPCQLRDAFSVWLRR